MLFLIFTIPVYVIGYSIYIWGQNTIKKQINDSEVKQVDYFISSFENEMERIQNLQFSFFNYKDLNTLTDASTILNNYDKDQSILEIEDRLLYIKNSSHYISEASVYIPNIHKKISSNDVEELNDEDYNLINTIYNSKNVTLFLWNGQLLLNAEGYISSNPYNGKYSKFFFEIQLSNDEINNSMKSIIGTYFQFITRSAPDRTKLAKEVEHAKIYAEIQASRFSYRINVQFDELPAEFENIVVERLIIENAFEYALESKVADGKLLAQFRKEAKFLIISVEDNGENLSDENLEKQKKLLENDDDGEEVTALMNIHRRIRNMSDKNCGLNLSRSQLGGLKAELRIELKEGEDAV